MIEIIQADAHVIQVYYTSSLQPGHEEWLDTKDDIQNIFIAVTTPLRLEAAALPNPVTR